MLKAEQVTSHVQELITSKNPFSVSTSYIKGDLDAVKLSNESESDNR
jgi:hypothetical protein